MADSYIHLTQKIMEQKAEIDDLKMDNSRRTIENMLLTLQVEELQLQLESQNSTKH